MTSATRAADSPGWAQRYAERLRSARRNRVLLEPSPDTELTDLAHAYVVQQAVTASRIAEGEKVVGYKLGYTSKPMREQMGVAEPNYGPLTDRMLLPTDSEVDDRLLQPRVEPEVGFVLRAPLSGSRIGRHQAFAAIGSAVACLEVVDSVWAGYRFRAEDNTADGSSAAQVVVGPRLPRLGSGVGEIGIVLGRNGIQFATGAAAAASGHPVDSLIWLVRELAAMGKGLATGDLVITGGLTAAVTLEPGDEIEADFGGGVRVGVRRSRRAGNAQPACKD
jgi:2-keto-4-pentenoate hydratase